MTIEYSFFNLQLIMSSYTTDSLFQGKLQVMQSRSGYRFSVDAILLAYYAAPKAAEKVLDLGTGCGIVSLIMAFRCTDLQIYAVEVQKELADLASANFRQNSLDNRIELMFADLNGLRPQVTGGPCDLIVTNPPYYRVGSGRINPDSQRALARHEIKTTLQDILLSSRRMLRTSGRFVCVYAAERTTDILSMMRLAHIEPKMIRMIHSNRGSDARLILIEGVNGARPGLKIEPPLFIYEEKGEYTTEVQRIFEMTDCNG
jgi:tRNA1Val (adenine37-N6)-methyltransferase